MTSETIHGITFTSRAGDPSYQNTKFSNKALGVESKVTKARRPPRNFRKETLSQRWYRAWNTIMEMNDRSDDYFFNELDPNSVFSSYFSRTVDEDMPDWLELDDIPDVASKEEVIAMLGEFRDFFWMAFDSYNWREEDDPFKGDYPWDGINESKLNEYKMIKVDLKNVNTIVYKNPTRQEFLALTTKHALRGLVDDTENLYVWDANRAIHFAMGQELALHVDDAGSGGVFYDTLMFISDKDIQWRYPEWTFSEVEGKDGYDVLMSARNQRRKEQGYSQGGGVRQANSVYKHSIERSPFVKKALGI